MKKSYLYGIIFILTGVVMFITNPDERKHREAVSVAILEVLSEKKTALQEQGNTLGGMIDNINDKMLGVVVKPLVNTSVSRKNYFVFSTTHLKLQDIDKTVGFGIFGKVFIAPQLKAEIKKYIDGASEHKLAE